MSNFLNFKKLKKLKIFQPLQISFVHTWFTFHKLNKLVKQKANTNLLKGFHPIEGNFLYVPASCLPYHISGYTTRTHEILKAISKAIEDKNTEDTINTTKENKALENAEKITNYTNTNAFKGSEPKLFVLTRTGYPWDRKDALSYPEDNKDYNVLDGIRYDHIRTPKNSKLTAIYAEEASLEIEKYIVKNSISCVHAASNHVNALPALIAAKRLGIPFQYEMRGLWELTRISRQPEFAKSHNFKLGLDLEAFVAKHADRVFVISEQLSKYIQRNWGIPKEKIHLLPNCADTDRIKPDFSSSNVSNVNSEGNEQSSNDKDYDKSINPNVNDCSSANSITNKQGDSHLPSNSIVIGYAGSLIVYEGIQILIRALDILINKKGYNSIFLNIIGDGEYRSVLENLVKELDLDSKVSFLGRLSPNDAKSKQDEFDVICIPRAPFEVCKIIPPIKLVEAMAKGKCVVVPDLPVFKDELSYLENTQESPSGCLFFKSGDFNDLASVLEKIIFLSNTNELKKNGERARQYVMDNRQWKHFATTICPIFNK